MFSAFTDPTTVTVSNTYFETNGRAIGYTIPNIIHKEWDMLAVMFNNGHEPADITLKSHTTLPHSWVIIANGDKAGVEELYRIDGNDIKIAPQCAMIMVDDKSFDRLSGKGGSKAAPRSAKPVKRIIKKPAKKQADTQADNLKLDK